MGPIKKRWVWALWRPSRSSQLRTRPIPLTNSVATLSLRVARSIPLCCSGIAGCSQPPTPPFTLSPSNSNRQRCGAAAAAGRCRCWPRGSAALSAPKAAAAQPPHCGRCRRCRRWLHSSRQDHRQAAGSSCPRASARLAVLLHAAPCSTGTSSICQGCQGTRMQAPRRSTASGDS